jgi:ribonuclease HI
MYFDGSLKLQGAGAGILFIAPGGEHLKYALQLLFPAFNNAAEYEALIHGLNIAISLGIKRLMVYGDSLVVISQINKEWDCSSDSMGKYLSGTIIRGTLKTPNSQLVTPISIKLQRPDGHD